jgi:uncharacterized protein (TIGR02757 family)
MLNFSAKMVTVFLDTFAHMKKNPSPDGHSNGVRFPVNDLKKFLDSKVAFYNQPAFVETDPIFVPHRFSDKEDIEISAFLVATIAWGNRKSIVSNGLRLMEMMDQRPGDFVRNFTEADLAPMETFVHRTFNSTDLLTFLYALRHIYLEHGGMEPAFSQGTLAGGSLREGIIHFRELFFQTPHLPRTRKHVSNPADGSAAKRINMFLRWMIRNDGCGVDFGLWKSFDPAQLFCPLDVHSGRVARKLGLLQRKQNDWKAVEELTANLRRLDPVDPIRYDFALFGMGVFEKQG